MEFIIVYQNYKKESKQGIKPSPKQKIRYQDKLEGIHYGDDHYLSNRIKPRPYSAYDPNSHESF
jgi:hypothetical protein